MPSRLQPRISRSISVTLLVLGLMNFIVCWMHASPDRPVALVGTPPVLACSGRLAIQQVIAKSDDGSVLFRGTSSIAFTNISQQDITLNFPANGKRYFTDGSWSVEEAPWDESVLKQFPVQLKPGEGKQIQWAAGGKTNPDKPKTLFWEITVLLDGKSIPVRVPILRQTKRQSDK